jgi:hypothetical protein
VLVASHSLLPSVAPPIPAPKTVSGATPRNAFESAAAASTTPAKKAEISNNPWLYLPAQTVFDAVVGYDWKTGSNKWSAKLTWRNVTDEDEIQTVRERGQPSRIIADLTVRF